MVDRLDKYPWSSHKGYLSGAKKWAWLYKDFVLSLFSNDKADNLKGYKAFISKETPEGINRILGRIGMEFNMNRYSSVSSVVHWNFSSVS